MSRHRAALLRDRRGGAAVDFAIVAPVLLLMLMGLFELAYQSYVQSVLTGAVQKAARDATIQGNDAKTDSLDAIVQNMVLAIVPGATFTSSRSNFDTYSAIAGEPFTDSQYPNTSSGSYDGICNHGETYVDLNGNGKYDLDLSQSGEGGASDISKYTMTVTYRRLFPIMTTIGFANTVTLSATTLLRNQPYATQSANSGTTKGTCS